MHISSADCLGCQWKWDGMGMGKTRAWNGRESESQQCSSTPLVSAKYMHLAISQYASGFLLFFRLFFLLFDSDLNS